MGIGGDLLGEVNAAGAVDGEAASRDGMLSDERAEGLEGFVRELAFGGAETSVFDDEDGGMEEFVEPEHLRRLWFRVEAGRLSHGPAFAKATAGQAAVGAASYS